MGEKEGEGVGGAMLDILSSYALFGFAPKCAVVPRCAMTKKAFFSLRSSESRVSHMCGWLQRTVTIAFSRLFAESPPGPFSLERVRL